MPTLETKYQNVINSKASLKTGETNSKMDCLNLIMSISTLRGVCMCMHAAHTHNTNH